MTLNPIGGITSDIEVTIGSGASLSDEVNMSGYFLTGLYVPAGWTPANMTIQASNGDDVFYDVYFGSDEYTLDAVGGRFLIVEPVKFAGIRRIKLRSGTSASPVNQGAERAIVMMVGDPS